jgi:hypothetical protein
MINRSRDVGDISGQTSLCGHATGRDDGAISSVTIEVWALSART